MTEGDWTNLTNIGDKSYDSMISMGRNILHEYQPHRQEQMFKEANRVLKVGGHYIFDIPNANKGHYQTLINDYADVMTRGRVQNFRENTIYDSPNGQDFLTRYVFSHQDIVDLTEKSGFKIVKIQSKELKNGSKDENIYYVLEKIADVK